MLIKGIGDKMTAWTIRKNGRHSLHKTNNFELSIIILIAGFDSLIKTSSQYEAANLQPDLFSQQQVRQHQLQLQQQQQQQLQDHEQLRQHQTALPNKQSFKVSSSSLAEAPSKSLMRSQQANPSQWTPYSSISSSNSPPTSVRSTNLVVGQSGDKSKSSRDDAGVMPSSLEPLPLVQSNARQSGKILDYTQSASPDVNSQQLRPIIAQWQPRQQITQPKSQQPQQQQSLQARVYNYLEPVTQLKLQPKQAADAMSNSIERVSPQGRVLLIDGRTAPVNEPQQTTSWSPQSARQDTSGSGSGSTSCDSTRSNQRGLKGMLRGAKNLLTGGLASIEQRAGGILWFGSNLLATLVPIASLIGLAPSFGSAASVIQSSTLAADKTNHSLGSTESPTGKRTGVATLLASLANGGAIAESGGLQGRVEYVMGWLERSIEHLPSFPRLHPQECVKRSICEAHHDPSRYGAIGLTLRLLFPASNLNSTSEMDNMEYKVINKYRHAAGYGLNKRLDNNGTASGPVCKEKYEDCLVSLLEIGQNLVDFFLTK